MMPQDSEKAIKSPDSDGAYSEDAGGFSGSFEDGEGLVNLGGRVFGRHGHADAAALCRDSGRTNGGSKNIVGEQLFRNMQGGFGPADDDRQDRAEGRRQRKTK